MKNPFLFFFLILWLLNKTLLDKCDQSAFSASNCEPAKQLKGNVAKGHKCFFTLVLNWIRRRKYCTVFIYSLYFSELEQLSCFFSCQTRVVHWTKSRCFTKRNSHSINKQIAKCTQSIHIHLIKTLSFFFLCLIVFFPFKALLVLDFILSKVRVLNIARCSVTLVLILHVLV